MSRFAAGLSRHPDPAVATAEMVGQVGDRLDAPPSVAMLFVAGRHVEAMHDIVDTVQVLMGSDVLIGTTAPGVVGGAEEIEGGDAVALWAATDLAATPLRLDALPGTTPVIVGLPDHLEMGSMMVVVADPSSFDVEALIERVDSTLPGVALAGGLSARSGPGETRLLLDHRIHEDGAVGFIVGPGVATPIVSQGCRPIGSPWVVTASEGRLVQELGGWPAIERLNELVEGLSAHDRAAAARGLHAGLLANERKADFDQGDFLIRAVLGADRSAGAIAIAHETSVGQVLQFQVRDAVSASEELARLLGAHRGRSGLLFTCNGRGSHLFPEPNHDAEMLSERVGPAVAGMFCGGELGPIADRNALHAFTATAVLFD